MSSMQFDDRRAAPGGEVTEERRREQLAERSVARALAEVPSTVTNEAGVTTNGRHAMAGQVAENAVARAVANNPDMPLGAQMKVADLASYQARGIDEQTRQERQRDKERPAHGASGLAMGALGRAIEEADDLPLAEALGSREARDKTNPAARNASGHRADSMTEDSLAEFISGRRAGEAAKLGQPLQQPLLREGPHAEAQTSLHPPLSEHREPQSLAAVPIGLEETAAALMRQGRQQESSLAFDQGGSWMDKHNEGPVFSRLARRTAA